MQIKNSLANGLRVPSGNTSGRLLELLFFACVLPFAGLLAFSDDPTGLHAGFPWAAAGALVFAARYGSLWGVLCALLMGIVINLPLFVHADLGGQHMALALGTVVMCLVVGDAASSWRTRSQQSEAENQYLRHRLKEFSTDYHVLRVSHGQLEEHMAGQRLSLREALQRLKPVLSSENEGIQAGSELMAVFSQFCSIQVAGLYTMTGDNRVDAHPVATHGDMFELPLFDPILRTAIKERELVSLKLESLDEKHHESSLLAAVPLVDTNGHLHGVLAIKDMHFMAFQQQNLNILALLGNYMGDMLTRSKGAAESRAAWFMTELDTALRFARTHSTDSVLLSLRFGTDELSERVARYVSTSIRSLDASWLLTADDGADVLCLLLPLMSETHGKAFMERIDSVVSREFGQPLSTFVTDSQFKSLCGSDSRAQCLSFLSTHTGEAALEADLQKDSNGSDMSGRQSDVA